MEERRTSLRTRSFLGGQISFNKGRSTEECIIRNLSANGAKLAFKHPVTIPNRFDLHIPQQKRSFRAKVAWCRADEVGVMLAPLERQFSSAAAAAGGGRRGSERVGVAKALRAGATR